MSIRNSKKYKQEEEEERGYLPSISLPCERAEATEMERRRRVEMENFIVSSLFKELL